MTKKQFRGLVDNLANVCTFNTSNSYSLSLRETEYKTGLIEYYRASLLVFTNDPCGIFCSSDIALLLSLATAWNVNLYFETVNGVTVAKYL